MGAAAYNRGSAVVRRQIDDEQPSAVMQLMRALTAYSMRHGGMVLFMPGVVRDSGDGAWYVMNKAETGWASHARRYRSLWRVASEYRVAFVGYGRDVHSAFFQVVPVAKVADVPAGTLVHAALEIAMAKVADVPAAAQPAGLAGTLVHASVADGGR